MKRTLGLLVIVFLIVAGSCNGQPKTNYEITTTSVTGVTKYHYFLEKKPATGNYHLVQGMDYLAPDVTTYKVGESATNSFTVQLDNDGAEYRAGVVFENVAGFYGGMGVVTANVGIVPITPAIVIFRKKP